MESGMSPLALRIAARFMRAVEERRERYKDMAPIGEVGVDSGCLVLIDPAYIEHWNTGEHPELSREHMLKMIKLDGEARTQFHFNNGIPAAVLIPSTGVGDGGYPVYVERHEDKRFEGTRDWSAVVDFNPRGDHKMARTIVAKYKSKKKVKKQDGGEMTVYEYSDRQIANREKKKAERIERLRGSIDKLRSKVKKDLHSQDPEKTLVALAVALMDNTYERVGNEESAKNGHVGVTGWCKKHVTFSSNGATIRYTGKSGVKHEKKVTDAATRTALRDAYDAQEGDDSPLLAWDGGKVTAEKINDYLGKFDVTAKDIRGYHANREVQERLKKARKAGGDLPENPKKRAKKLKAEFDAALEEAAEAVGHEASTLRSQYLVPGLEDSYLKDGTVTDKLSSWV
jgi:hypothetical protein